MKIRKSSLTVAMAALMSAGLVGQAAAYTSAGSVIEYQNLQIFLNNDVGEATQSVENFNFVTTNTTTLNGTTIAASDSCLGQFGTGGLITTCSGGTPTLDAPLQDLGATGHGENDFELDGPASATTYSYSDSVVQSAALVTGDPTKASLIAETALVTSGEGNSSSIIQSTTGFVFNFILVDSGDLTISFQADPDAYAASNNPGSILTIAEASIAASVVLAQDFEADGSLGDGAATWAPNGLVDGCSGLAGGVTCDDNAGTDEDDESLNTKVGVTSDPNLDPYSMDAQGSWSDFSITMEGLDAGEWTFTLTTTVANSVAKRVPEPGILMLLGIGLAGLAATRRRKKA